MTLSSWQNVRCFDFVWSGTSRCDALLPISHCTISSHWINKKNLPNKTLLSLLRVMKSNFCLFFLSENSLKRLLCLEFSIPLNLHGKNQLVIEFPSSLNYYTKLLERIFSWACAISVVLNSEWPLTNMKHWTQSLLLFDHLCREKNNRAWEKKNQGVKKTRRRGSVRVVKIKWIFIV